MKNTLSKNACIAVCLKTDYITGDYFLPAGTKIFVFPGRSLLLAFTFFIPLGEIHFLQCPMVAIMTETEMEKRNKTGKAQLTFLEADKLFLSLSPVERKTIWPQMTNK